MLRQCDLQLPGQERGHRRLGIWTVFVNLKAKHAVIEGKRLLDAVYLEK
jgi:hypothetical protein